MIIVEMGLIIYYMSKNPQYKISEILNSIDYTYEKYLEELKEGRLNVIEVIKPNYRFISF
ncbi:hypothetical protein J11TS1_26880 [Oceanobacillus sp. J11TS1]|nr:hypothetical protein J11TS1_26880 [Oceanobacillus sp. J11TS1]